MKRGTGAPGNLQDHCDVHFVHEDRVRRARVTMGSDDDVRELAGSFKLLGDPTRLKILVAVAREELCVCDIAALLGMTESAISHQLRVLRQGRLVRLRRAGQMAYYSQCDHHIRDLVAVCLERVAGREKAV